MLGYLYSWATNLASAGVKLIPLGQTAGQQLLLDLRSQISCTTQEVLKLEDDDLASCSWGLAWLVCATKLSTLDYFAVKNRKEVRQRIL